MRRRPWDGTLTPSSDGPLPLAGVGQVPGFSSSPGVLPVLGQAELRAAVQELPAAVGDGLASWNWKVAHRFVSERSGISLSRSSCLNYPRFHEGRLCRAAARTSTRMRQSGAG